MRAARIDMRILGAKRLHILIALAVAALAAATYARTLDYGFVWDDKMILREDTRSLDVRQSLRAFSENIDRLYRPLRTITYAIDAKFVTPKHPTRPYHVTNILLYALSAAALYIFLLVLTGRTGFAAAAAALFAVHPVHAESAAWISGRADLMAMAAMCFSFSLLIVFSRGAKSAATLIPGLLFYVAALLSKETAATGFAILACCFILFPPENKKNYAIKAFYTTTMVAVITLLYIYIRSFVAPNTGQATTPIGDTLTARLAAFAPAFADYHRLSILPLRQCLVYELAAPKPPYLATIATAAALVAVAVALGIILRKKAPVVSFAAAWWILTLIPVSNIIPIPLIEAERFLFLPSAAWCMIAAGVFLIDRPTVLRLPLRAFFFALFVAYIALSAQRIPVFESEYKIWSDTSKCATASTIAHFNFGNECMKKEQYLNAIEEYERVIELKPEYFPAYANIGDAYALMGKYDSAIPYFKMSLDRMPNQPKVMIKISLAYDKMKRHEEAKLWHEKVRKIVK